MTDYTDEEIGWARLIHYISASLTAIGATYVVISHWRDSRQTIFPLRLAYFLSVSDLFCALSALLAAATLPSLTTDIEDMNPVSCFIQGSSFFFFKVASALWTGAISFTIYRMIVHLDTNVARFEKYYHMICWGFPGICMIGFFSANIIGPVQVFCYVDKEHFYIAAIIFTITVVSLMIFDSIMYMRTLRGLRAHRDAMNEQLLSTKVHSRYETKIIQRITVIPLLFMVTYAWLLLYLALTAFETPLNYYLLFLDQVFVPLEGFWNSMVYGSNKALKRKHDSQVHLTATAEAS